MPEIATTLNSYRRLLCEVDNWFKACLRAGSSALACRVGCSGCCRGLFDITLMDAWLIKSAFADLAVDVQKQVLQRCQTRLDELRQHWPDLHNPYLLNSFPQEQWSSMPENDQTPCPLLADNGDCLVYRSRPLICRLHGLPNIDVSGEDFDGTVCSLHPGDPMTLPEQVLRWHFREVFTQEVDLFRAFTATLTGISHNELDTFIPLALLADYSSVDWQDLPL